MEELKHKFEALSDDEKLCFMKMMLPAICEMFKGNPQDMLPFCREILQHCDLDMNHVVKMMNMIMEKDSGCSDRSAETS